MQTDLDINLTVKSIHVEAEGVISIGLVASDGQALPAWTPGAHITVVVGSQLERQYSLCGDPGNADEWQIAVLKEPESRGGSTWIHDHLKVGDVLRAGLPSNQFPLDSASAYKFVAGGIGITPFLPMIQSLSRRGASWQLLYGGRHLRSMAFVEMLRRYGKRVLVVPEDQHGLLDLKGWIGSPQPGEVIYCCGPERLLQAVEAHGEAWPEGVLHIERFRARPGALEGSVDSNAPFEVVLAKSGRSCSVGPDETIIDALDKVGVHVPRSCGEGTCGTCLTTVLEGTPDHRDSFLMGKKRAANNAICVCCSRSSSAKLVLDL